LGSRVTVQAGDLQMTRVHHGKSGYLGFSSAPLYFGLDGRERVDWVEVEWPAGARQRVAPEGVNRRLEIVEPAAN
ncbi:MAG: ASPIC/UnbV domain-containing protein, partial [Thermoanaerobaculia bacterium]|nr:ASPIC/UnbV domain-containing protein [Thermoanaerobaculia bacterium]